MKREKVKIGRKDLLLMYTQFERTTCWTLLYSRKEALVHSHIVLCLEFQEEGRMRIIGIQWCAECVGAGGSGETKNHLTSSSPDSLSQTHTAITSQDNNSSYPSLNET